MCTIKFKSRENIHSSKQLAKYVLTDKGTIERPLETALIRNINELDINDMHKAYLTNEKYRKQRKNGIALLHEMVCLEKDFAHHATPEILKDLMETYIKMRGAEQALCIAQIHNNGQHLHFMFSASNLRSSKSDLRLSNKKMKELLINFEIYHLQKYPQLKSIVHTNKRERKRDIANEERNTRREAEFWMKKNNPDKKTKKDRAFELVSEILDRAQTKDDLIKALQESKELQIYTYDGVMKGIILGNIKFRFGTIGIEKERIQKLEKIQSRLEELKLLKEMQSSRKKRSLYRGRNS
jgi:hypothetical protein